MARRNILRAAAIAFAAAACTPAFAAVVTTNVEVSGLFVGGGDLTGNFGVTWNTSTGNLASIPVRNNPFGFVTSSGLSQGGQTLTGFAYNPSDASIALNALGDTITVTSPAGATGLNREYQIKLTFADPLIELVDGSISSDPLQIQQLPYPTAAGDPISGECENQSGLGSSFCRVETRRFLSSGVAAIPEPSTWALMLIGFAGLSYTGYRKRRAYLRAT